MEERSLVPRVFSDKKAKRKFSEELVNSGCWSETKGSGEVLFEWVVGYTPYFAPALHGKMEPEGQWWKGQLAADIHQSLRIKCKL
ncbi:hypothetical protein SKAU_G00424690 [Synaphobranchus kaupii]|uniref:Uncharacterized protein n=1 Tax=Synaphobranchus kaupii TaxID=118154 RepID=A0A9Q1E5W3_SYNKA|nr:hypothetical protein SKAU_G00424690 [Synaphobranchus kaupii]